MKRTVCVIILLALLLCSCGRSSDAVDFYYLRTCNHQDDYHAYFSEGAIIAEERDVSGHRNDLNYLLTMYLRGPMDPQLKSPFPAGCSLIDVYMEGRELTVYLSSGASLLDDLDLNIACACLAKTCMQIAGTDTVHIQSRSTGNLILFSTTITSDDLLLEVTLPPETVPAEEIQ